MRCFSYGCQNHKFLMQVFLKKAIKYELHKYKCLEVPININTNDVDMDTKPEEVWVRKGHMIESEVNPSDCEWAVSFLLACKVYIIDSVTYTINQFIIDLGRIML